MRVQGNANDTNHVSLPTPHLSLPAPRLSLPTPRFTAHSTHGDTLRVQGSTSEANSANNTGTTDDETNHNTRAGGNSPQQSTEGSTVSQWGNIRRSARLRTTTATTLHLQPQSPTTPTTPTSAQPSISEPAPAPRQTSSAPLRKRTAPALKRPKPQDNIRAALQAELDSVSKEQRLVYLVSIPARLIKARC